MESISTELYIRALIRYIIRDLIVKPAMDEVKVFEEFIVHWLTTDELLRDNDKGAKKKKGRMMVTIKPICQRTNIAKTKTSTRYR